MIADRLPVQSGFVDLSETPSILWAEFAYSQSTSFCVRHRFQLVEEGNGKKGGRRSKKDVFPHDIVAVASLVPQPQGSI